MGVKADGTDKLPQKLCLCPHLFYREKLSQNLQPKQLDLQLGRLSNDIRWCQSDSKSVVQHASIVLLQQ